MSPQEREYFDQVAGLRWLKESRVLVPPAKLGTDGATGRVIIAVCDTAFSNVPRRRFGVAPLTHAVGYDDGSVGLISAEEFRRLELRGFVDVRSLARRDGKPNARLDETQERALP